MKKRFSIVDMTVKKKITLFSALMLIMLILVSAVGLWSSKMLTRRPSASFDNTPIPSNNLPKALLN